MALPIAGLLALLAVGPGAAEAGQRQGEYGRVEVSKESPTSQGTWDGTWMHVARDARIVLFMRTVEGKPEVRLQYQSMVGPEAFETDWQGACTYFLSGQAAHFAFTLDRRTPDEMTGSWDWQLEFSDSGRTEVGKFHLFRVDTGRRAMLAFDSWERQIRRGDKLHRFPATPVLSFVKVSKRLILWDEVF